MNRMERTVKTINAVPESINGADYRAFFETLGFDLKRLRQLDFRPDGVYATVSETNEQGREMIDQMTEKLIQSTVYIPVKG